MRVLTIGAAGPTGQQLVAQALAAGHAVTALVRDAARADFAPAVQKVAGDVLDSGSLARAVASQEAVICSLGSGATGPFKQITLLLAGTVNLVAAMKQAGVNRLVRLTGIGAGESRGHGPWWYDWLVQPLVLRGAYQNKNRQEAVVRGSGLDWTLVRPGALTNAPTQGTRAVRVLTDLAGVRTGFSSRADVAASRLSELADGHYRQQAPVLTY